MMCVKKKKKKKSVNESMNEYISESGNGGTH